ncbi:hypothetical protein PV350_39440 [Streptomyces sp. PA03-6a]|nr:hypothetical protein [Streptomyces sp. PA03-6a]
MCLLHALCAPGAAALQPLERTAAVAVAAATDEPGKQMHHPPASVGRRTVPQAGPQQRAGTVQGHAADIVHDTCPPDPVGSALRGPARHVAPAGRPDHLHLVLRC